MKPVLLDLFCGAGGCGEGYHRAGFEVIGVDLAPQPNYPFVFFMDDALKVLDSYLKYGEWGGRTFDAIHASPPCQHYAGVTKWRGNADDHPDLIGPVQERIRATGLPYVIENVPDARRHLHHPFRLCGTALGLRVRRHRYFEAPWWPHPLQAPCQHRADDYAFDHGSKQPESVYREAMECFWMTVEESREAVPPAYTEFIGGHLLTHVQQKVAA